MQLAPQPGTLLADRYRLVRPLARGGMGSVWRAEHLALNSEVAVKIIDPFAASRALGVPRFLREARALAALRSPHIVQVLDFGSDGEIVYLVMELLEGRTLGQRLKAEGKLSAAETNRILSQVCRAMSHAHARGIVHRDLKPDNIFLCDQSREHVTKVVDFGIAKSIVDVATSDTGTEAGTLLGTPSYMSPEQCRGSERIDARSDLWALGAIAYECLLGQRLFDGDAIGDLLVRICTEALPVAGTARGLPPGFDAWLQRAMARNPGERFQSAAELARGLSAVLEVSAVSAPGADSAETLQTDGAAAQPPSSAPGLGSTLENGSLERPAGQPQQQRRFALRLVVSGAGIIALLALVVFVRRVVSAPPVAPTDVVVGAAASTAPAAAAAGPSSEVSVTAIGSSPGNASEANASEDSGESQRSSVEQALVGKVPPVRVAPRRAFARSAKGGGTPAQTEPGVDALRKKR
ncbi:MAG: serine/threonine-protein kinase [Deltaproteobacteria bacterium]